VAVSAVERDTNQDALEFRQRLVEPRDGAVVRLRLRPERQRGSPVGLRRGRDDVHFGRQVLQLDLAARCERGESPAQIHELAHVARPAIRLQTFQRHRRQRLGFGSQLHGGLSQVMREQVGNVLRARTQRR
jgi:hypothetical protein